MSYRGKRVLVTGADGFIGSHLAEALVRENAEVTALACTTFGPPWLADDADRTARADAPRARRHPRRRLDDAFAEGRRGVPSRRADRHSYSYDSAQSYVDVNVTGTLNILEAARMPWARGPHLHQRGVWHSATQPIAESHPLVAQSPYVATKIAADKLANPTPVLRSAGRDPAPVQHVPHARAARRYPHGDRQALDPACDVWWATRHPRAISITSPTRPRLSPPRAHGERLAFGRAYNTGTGVAVSIAEMIEMVRAVTAPTSAGARRLPRAAGEMEVRAALRLARAVSGDGLEAHDRSEIGHRHHGRLRRHLAAALYAIAWSNGKAAQNAGRRRAEPRTASGGRAGSTNHNALAIGHALEPADLIAQRAR